MATLYLALYKGRAKQWRERLEDGVIRCLTKGQYSHCEIAVKKRKITGHYDCNEWFECYTSSPRDGGVRCKIIDVDDTQKWDLIPLEGVTEAQIRLFFTLTQGKKYDWWGALGIVLGIKQKRSKFFCSEWCFNAIFNSDQGWRFSPNDLEVIVRNK